MNEEEFLARWVADQPIYEAWGRFVASTIKGNLAPSIAPVSIDVFLRLPVEPRLKSGGSIITKAFYRKTYADPYGDMTDKVGVRFVVLLAKDIPRVEHALTSSKFWTHSKDRDYVAEREKDPIKFDYQSVHYVVRAADDIKVGEQVVPKGLPCEVQIRTMLQHAYSELTHDTIYKPSVEATPEAKRAAAKSMALIEATNDYFEEVHGEIEKVTGPLIKATEFFAGLYRQVIGVNSEQTPMEGLLVSAFGEAAGDRGILEALAPFYREKDYLPRIIADRAKSKMLYRQPSIMLIYHLVALGPEQTREKWPLTPAELAPIFSDLGESFSA